jgi:hypothetical protein
MVTVPLFRARSYSHGWPVGLLLAAPCVHGASSLDVCSEPAPERAFRAAYQLYDDASVSGADLARDNWAVDAMFRAGDDWLMGGAYRGTLIDESEAGFRTNGYLHSFYFALHRLRTGDRRLRWAIAPALSGSSNVTKDSDEYDGEAWQFNFAAVWEWPANDALSYRAGLCADHRFGRYRAYPVLALSLKPHPDWLLEAGFPDTQIHYRPGAVLGAALAIYPNGNEWYVKDDTLEYASMFEYRAWAVDLSLHWRVSEAIALAFIAGMDVDAEYRGELEDGSRPALDAGTVGRAGIEFAWVF